MSTRTGVAAIQGREDRLLVGLQLEGEIAATRFAVIDARGTWSEAPRTIREILRSARDAAPADCVGWEEWRERLAPFVRSMLREAADGNWRVAPQGPQSRELIARLQTILRRATRARDTTTLTRLEPLFAFVARGHTAGEAQLVEEWATLDDEALTQKGDGLPEPREAVGAGRTLRIVGAIVEVAGQ